jgi:hypothetical protein
MQELQIIVNQQTGIITTNFDDVKQALASQMEIYKSLDVTEENKTERKKDVATLRKMIKAVNDKRIEVKKECLKPYEDFEKRARELIDIISEPINLLDNQIKEYEDKQRQEKINTIKQIFTEVAGELAEYIALEQIYDSKWENVATSIKSIREDITAKFIEIHSAITAIKATGSEKVQEALDRYYNNLDLASAITFINQYEQQKREIERRMREQQERERQAELERERERIRREEREAIEREERIKAEAEAKARAEQEAKERAEREAMAIKHQTGATEKRLYGITATHEEFEQVEMYLSSLGLDYERV